MSELKKSEILKIVNRYIGVSGGYLGDFSYRTHEDFYPEYCGLDIKPSNFEGTTRERFIAILEAVKPYDQVKIIHGTLKRFPVGNEGPETRTQMLYDELLDTAKRLEGITSIDSPDLNITSEVVERAIDDAEILIQTNGPTSAIDRIHTVLHGYLIAVCNSACIKYPPDAGVTKLIRMLHDKHPALNNVGVQPQDINKILNSLSSIMDALGTIRNRASVAHPNENLLGKDEAMLVINAARTILHYLDAKFSVDQA